MLIFWTRSLLFPSTLLKLHSFSDGTRTHSHLRLGLEPMIPDLGGDSDPLSFFKNYLLLFFYFWLCWVFIAVHGLSLVAASRDYSSLRRAGFLL